MVKFVVSLLSIPHQNHKPFNTYIMSKETKQMTNAEFVQELMEGYNPHGALAQMVVIDALAKGLELIVSGKDELLKTYDKDQADGKFSFIHIPSWVDCAEGLLDEVNQKYK